MEVVVAHDARTTPTATQAATEVRANKGQCTGRGFGPGPGRDRAPGRAHGAWPRAKKFSRDAARGPLRSRSRCRGRPGRTLASGRDTRRGEADVGHVRHYRTLPGPTAKPSAGPAGSPSCLAPGRPRARAASAPSPRPALRARRPRRPPRRTGVQERVEGDAEGEHPEGMKAFTCEKNRGRARTRQERRPRPQDEHAAPVAVAEAQEAVVDVVLVGRVEARPRAVRRMKAKAMSMRAPQDEEGDEHWGEEEVGRARGRGCGTDHHGRGRHQQAEQQRAGVTHEDLGRVEVERQNPTHTRRRSPPPEATLSRGSSPMSMSRSP